MNSFPRLFLLAGLGSGSFATAARAQAVADYPVRPVPFTQVKPADNFWLPRLKTNTEVIIPALFQRCEATSRVKNFEMAAAKSGRFATMFPFDDTDIYKTIEGASYSLSLYPDEHLKQYVDALIAKVAAAQEPDCYLYTARTIDPAHPHPWAGRTRWEKERELSHELYNAGHFYEAAVAHYQATGQKNFLTIALKMPTSCAPLSAPASGRLRPATKSWKWAW